MNALLRRLPAFLKVTDVYDGNLSLTSIALVLTLGAALLSPTSVTATLFAVSALLYGAKRITNRQVSIQILQAEISQQTDIEVLCEEFAAFKESRMEDVSVFQATVKGIESKLDSLAFSNKLQHKTR